MPQMQDQNLASGSKFENCSISFVKMHTSQGKYALVKHLQIALTIFLYKKNHQNIPFSWNARGSKNMTIYGCSRCDPDHVLVTVANRKCELKK